MLPTSGPRYPAIRVRTRSPNPFALIAAVRYALWRARVEPAEIDRFTEAALTEPRPDAAARVCREWVSVVAG